MKKIIRKLLNYYISDDYQKKLFWEYRNKYKESNFKLKKIYYSLKYRKINRRYNSSIPIETKIYGEVVLPHGLNGIFISQGAKIGKNCTIFHQVTIGSNTLEDTKKNGAPIIGDNVYIGSGSKIIGGIKIGDNVRIGANCVIVQDIPSNHTVVMNKPRLIPHKFKKDNSFKEYKFKKY